MSTETVGASRAVERREDARVGKRERVRGSIRAPPTSASPASANCRRAAGVTAGRSALTTSACPSMRARPAATAAPRPEPGSTTTSAPGGTTVGSSVTTRTRPTASAASTTSPSIATANAARTEAGRRRFASPRYGITMAGTRRSVLRRRSRTCCRRRGRRSPTRGRRTSASREAPRPRRDPCGRG